MERVINKTAKFSNYTATVFSPESFENEWKWHQFLIDHLTVGDCVVRKNDPKKNTRTECVSEIHYIYEQINMESAIYDFGDPIGYFFSCVSDDDGEIEHHGEIPFLEIESIALIRKDGVDMAAVAEHYKH